MYVVILCSKKRGSFVIYILFRLAYFIPNKTFAWLVLRLNLLKEMPLVMTICKCLKVQHYLNLVWLSKCWKEILFEAYTYCRIMTNIEKEQLIQHTYTDL